ncbi:hypothetical protein ACT3SQ_08850 [Brachybacterium sp. AOP42-C2-15]|uniref:hypothetical protein n=1 Tax=Brachybacterium sp. AOP42-C2-15 TaxID=3457670 RepID=UPI004033DA27
MSTTTAKEKAMGHKFDEQGKAEYAEEIRKRWESGVLTGEEAVTLLTMLELADEDGNVVLPDDEVSV